MALAKGDSNFIVPHTILTRLIRQTIFIFEANRLVQSQFLIYTENLFLFPSLYLFCKLVPLCIDTVVVAMLTSICVNILLLMN